MIASWVTYASLNFVVTRMSFCCSVTQSWRFLSRPDSHSCLEKMLMQSILLCILPGSLISEVSKRHLAELCQEIIWALPSEIMPSEQQLQDEESLLHSQGCKWPWISGNSPLMPQQSMVPSPLQSCFLGRKSMLTVCWSLPWCCAGVCRKLCF